MLVVIRVPDTAERTIRRAAGDISELIADGKSVSCEIVGKLEQGKVFGPYDIKTYE